MPSTKPSDSSGFKDMPYTPPAEGAFPKKPTNPKGDAQSEDGMRQIPGPPPLPEPGSFESLHRRIESNLSEEGALRQKQTIKKLNKAKEKLTHKKTNFEREIQVKSEAMKLDQISSRIKEASHLQKGLFEIEAFATSQNPVGKIGGVQFVGKTELAQIIQTMKENIYKKTLTILAKSAKEMPPDDLKNITPFLKNFDNQYKTNYEIGLVNLIKALKNYHNQSANITSLTLAIEDLQKVNPPPELTLDTDVFYSKDNVSNELRLQLLKETEGQSEIGEKAALLLNAINQIQLEVGPYISQANLKSERLGVDILRFQPKLTQFISKAEFLIANHHSGPALDVIAMAAKLKGDQEPQFVFKTGLENIREQLAAKLLTSMGLSKPLVPKINVSLAGATIKKQDNPEGIASKFLEGSSSISSEQWQRYLWCKRDFAIAQYHQAKIDDIEIQLPALDETLNNQYRESENIKEVLNEAKAHLESSIDALKDKKKKLKKLMGSLRNKTEIEAVRNMIKVKQGELAEVLERIKSHASTGGADLIRSIKERDNLQAEKSRLQAFVNAKTLEYQHAKRNLLATLDHLKLKDIQTHVLTDLLFCSSDSHSGQYLQTDDGHIVNIDFARFLPPAECYIVNGRVKSALLSSLLAHPAVDQPLSPKICQQIAAWNLDQLEKEWRDEDLIGAPKSFRMASIDLEDVIRDLNSVERVSENSLSNLEINSFILDICKRNSINPRSIDRTDFKTLKSSLIAHLTQKREELQKACFSKVHPAAFADFKKRAQILKAYVKHCLETHTDPNLRDAFTSMYPKLAVCLKITERVYGINSRSQQTKTFNEALEDARQKKLITIAEEQQMVQAIQEMSAIGADPLDGITTMN